MKITVLTENTSRGSLGSEHGLSLYIETEDDVILFDTGQTGLFAENAQKLGKDISAVKKCVISHGHYDHGGGLERFLELNSTAPVYLSRYAFEGHYNASDKYNGLDPSLKDSGRLVFTDGETSIGKGETLYSAHNMKTVVEMGAFGLKMERGGSLVPDDFRHEHYLLIEENGKRVLFSGCSHRGVVNITEFFRPDVLVGGFHFFKLETGEELAGLGRRLDKYPAKYYTCHCTGVGQYEFLRGFMSSISYISAGDMIEIA